MLCPVALREQRIVLVIWIFSVHVVVLCYLGIEGSMYVFSKKNSHTNGEMWDNYQEVYTMSASILIDGAIRDGNLVTAPAWPAHPAWLKEFAAMLEDQVRMAG
jgi:hypothetical protein